MRCAAALRNLVKHGQPARGRQIAPARHRSRFHAAPDSLRPAPGSAAIPLERLQHRLQSIYELNIAHSVGDYLLTNREEAARLDPGSAFRNAREKLLIREDPDGVRLSLYLDSAVVAGLREGDRPAGADIGSVQDFCLALEGVSHFLYLVWNATHDRSVSLLEMELQAEVDKFVVLRRLFEPRPGPDRAGPLLQLLFQTAAYHHEMGEAEQRRYRRASRFAEQYCRRLEAAFARPGRSEGLLRELRRFYRLTQRDKMSYIGAGY
ncbi:MAG: hypothetical protein HYY36_01035 [Gammaproteobacteria bacterium]|nr:hypothetical protein [Gammaproteobacteria bacterium]